MRHALYGLAVGAALATAAAAWFLSSARTTLQPVIHRPVAIPAPEAAAQQAAAAVLQQTIAQPAPRTSSADFEARFKASREASRPAPDPAILQARSFPEAFHAMKRAEGPPPAQDAGVNPFGAAR